MNSPSKTPDRTEPRARPARQLSCDMAMASRFLQLLDPDANSFTFQTLDDGGNNLELSYVLHGHLEACAHRLQVLNHYGAGVFVSVNETNGQGRALQQDKQVRAVWQKNDSQEHPLPLEPHMVVASGPHQYHRYLLVEGLTFAQARAIQETLVSYYGSDYAAQDLTGVLRVPGFYYRHGQPHLVRLIRASCISPYPAAALMNAFPVIALPCKRRRPTRRDASTRGQPVYPPQTQSSTLGTK